LALSLMSNQVFMKPYIYSSCQHKAKHMV
jgi:hypothetical protein